MYDHFSSLVPYFKPMIFPEFVATAQYVDWLQQETGVSFNPEAVPEVAPEAVHFV